MVQIIPAVLETTTDEYKNSVNKLSSCEALKEGFLHIDFADGNFVESKTVDVDATSRVHTNFKKEAHLMVSHPKEWIEKLVEAGFKRIIFHIESKDDVNEIIDNIKSKGLEVGLAIKHETPLEKLEPFIDKIDIVLVMTIIPGFQGQPFIPEALEKVKMIKSKWWRVRVGVDGHVNDEDVKEIVDSGVDFMIVGSYFLKGDVDENLERLWEILNG